MNQNNFDDGQRFLQMCPAHKITTGASGPDYRSKFPLKRTRPQPPECRPIKLRHREETVTHCRGQITGSACKLRGSRGSRTYGQPRTTYSGYAHPWTNCSAGSGTPCNFQMQLGLR
jgi:hypothetical protein